MAKQVTNGGRRCRFAFVVPRYFDGIAGGAETLMGAMAQQLQLRGDEVQILTTCAKDNRTWDNEFEEGPEIINGLDVRRFRVDDRDLDRWIPIQLGIHDGREVSVADQLQWMTHSVNASGLYRYLKARGGEFDAIFFGPYLFGTTFWGSLIHPDRSVLFPCLHDESYAYQSVIASMFRQVRGAMFNAYPEMQLAQSLYGEIPGGVVGMGFVPPPVAEVEALEPFPLRAGAAPNQKYILYLGRKETGKNVQTLIDYFCSAKELGLIDEDIQLAILGGGSFSDLHRPAALNRGDVIDLPHVSERDKQRILRHALFLCQPSTNESFSIVMMEAWMVGTPVAVHAECSVTKHHAIHSNGGLYFSGAEDFGGITRYLNDAPDARENFARSGRAYVEREYSWSAVLNRFDETLTDLGLLSNNGASQAKDAERSIPSSGT